MFTLPKAKTPNVPATGPSDGELAATRALLQTQQTQLDADRKAFNDYQQQTQAQLAQLAISSINRATAASQNTQPTPPMVSSDGAASETDQNVNAMRKGRKALRIDLQAASSDMLGGLNVPRG